MSTANSVGLKDIIKSMGLVFGDIGVSPIYTLSAIFMLLPRTSDNIIGSCSLIIWTLILLVSIQYAWLVMSLSRKGEGGTIVLKEILTPLLTSKKGIALVSFLTFLGISLLIGDGVITPAISILSAVEGLRLIPGLYATKTIIIVLIAALIAIILFLYQRKGSDHVAIAFGPIMLVWFIAIGLYGLYWIMQTPMILHALNPCYGLSFLYQQGINGFFILSLVVLAVTGVEALYADMGHLGRKPITYAWHFVFISLVLNYLGQGAFIINNPGVKEVLFEMVFNTTSMLYIPFLILSILAAIIASQAMISGVYSIVYQGIATRILPILKVDYTSTTLRSQIYIDFANWFLLISVLIIMFIFKEASKLTAAYGLAVTGTMTITSIMTAAIFWIKKKYIKATIASFSIILTSTFLLSSMTKIPQGGIWSIVIALIPFTIIMIYTKGRTRIYELIQALDLCFFVRKYNEIEPQAHKICGTALFFTKNANKIPPYIIKTMFTDNIIYEDNILVSIKILDTPFGFEGHIEKVIGKGLRSFKIEAGYMEVLQIEDIFKKAGINEKVIFYGTEVISTKKMHWKIFSLIRKLTPSYIELYKLPTEKLHGIITRVEM